MGPVKAGKSTFLNTLSGRYDGHPLQCCWGTLLLQGKPLTPEHRPHLVPQHVRTHDQRLMEALLSLFASRVVSAYLLADGAKWQQAH